MASKEKRYRRESGKLLALNEEELIRQVELRPILYNKSLKGYRKSALRYQYWSEVGDVIGAKVEECRRRWRSLRDAFSKHYKHVNRFEETPKKKRKKWIFYDQMSFIAPYLDNTYSELEDTLLEDFPDNSEDSDTKVVHDNSGNCDLHVINAAEESSMGHHLEVEQKLFASDGGKCRKSSDIGEESQFIASILHGTPNSPSTVNLQQMEQEEEKDNKANEQHLSSLQAQEAMQSCLDSDEKFLMSCAPILKRLSNRKNALARLKIQQILYNIEFDCEER